MAIPKIGVGSEADTFVEMLHRMSVLQDEESTQGSTVCDNLGASRGYTNASGRDISHFPNGGFQLKDRRSSRTIHLEMDVQLECCKAVVNHSPEWNENAEDFCLVSLSICLRGHSLISLSLFSY